MKLVQTLLLQDIPLVAQSSTIFTRELSNTQLVMAVYIKITKIALKVK